MKVSRATVIVASAFRHPSRALVMHAVRLAPASPLSSTVWRHLKTPSLHFASAPSFFPMNVAPAFFSVAWHLTTALGSAAARTLDGAPNEIATKVAAVARCTHVRTDRESEIRRPMLNVTSGLLVVGGLVSFEADSDPRATGLSNVR